MYILSGSLTSFVCAPNSAHPRPRSGRPRLAEPSPHFSGAVGNTAWTRHRRDWTDPDDWQRLGRRDWLPFRPPAQQGSAPAAPHIPPPVRAAPRSCTCKTSRGARRGAPATHPPPRRQRAAAGSSCRSPGAGRGTLLGAAAPPCLRLRGCGISLYGWEQPTSRAAAGLSARLPFFFGHHSFSDEAGKHALMQRTHPHTHARPRLCVLVPKVGN